MLARTRRRMAALALSLGASIVVPAARAGDSAAPQLGPDASTPTAAPPAPVGAGIPETVEVRGARPEPGGQQLRGPEVREVPGAFGDAFRAIEALPGVVPLVSGLPYFLVRGAPPGNTGFFLDGVRVPALFHLGVGAAIVHPGLIERVDFYPGGYPAHFGRFTGGILSGEVARAPDRPHAEASVRLLDAGALASTPFAGERGDVLVSGRYGYPGPLLALFAPNVGLAYWDYQAKARWRVTDRDEIGAFVFGSFDSVSSRDQATGVWSELLGIQFHRADLRWDRATSETGRLRVALTLGYDRSAAGQTSTSATIDSGPPGAAGSSPTVVTTNPVDSIESEDVRLRAEWSERLSSALGVRLGSDVDVAPVRVRIAEGRSLSGLSTTDISKPAAGFEQLDVNGGVLGELDWRPSRAVEVRPGLRVDAFTSRSPDGKALLWGDSGAGRAAGALDPRLAARWDATEWLAWTAALGVAHQASNIPLPSPGLQFSQLSRGVQAAYQYSAGTEIKLPLKVTLTADAFLHDYTGIADFFESCPAGEAACTFDGRSVGFELLVRRRLTERLTGWISYTLSRTERDAFYLGRWMRRLSEFDRTHVLNVLLAADLGNRWRAGVRALAYSGLPYSTATGFEGPPDARGPPFLRVDLRIEKKWRWLGGTLALVFEWLNALLSKETFGTDCQAGPASARTLPTQTCEPTQIGPITFPSVGVEETW
jgi:hypothetical protein